MKNTDLILNKYYFNKIYLFDYYYNKAFLKNLLFFSFLFLLVYVFGIILGQLPSILSKSSYNNFVTLPHVFSFYLYQFPNYLNTTLPFSFLFSVSYSLGDLYTSKGALIFVASGVPLWRLSLGNVVIAFIVSLLLVMLNTTLFPQMLIKYIEYDHKLSIYSKQDYIENIQVNDSHHNLYIGGSFSVINDTLYNFTILEKAENPSVMFHQGMRFKEYQKLSLDQKKKIWNQFDMEKVPKGFLFHRIIRGEKLVFNLNTKKWQLFHGVYIDVDPQKLEIKNIQHFDTLVLPELNAKIETFRHSNKSIDELTIHETLLYIKDLKSNNEPVLEILIEFWNKKFLDPFSLFFLTLIIVNVGQFFSRKNLLIYTLILSFCLTFGFFLMVNFIQSLIKAHSIPFVFGMFLSYLPVVIFYTYFKWKQKT